MKARHFVFAREILSPQRNMLQMKICKEDMFLKVVALPLFGGCAPNEIKSILDIMGTGFLKVVPATETATVL